MSQSRPLRSPWPQAQPKVLPIEAAEPRTHHWKPPSRSRGPSTPALRPTFSCHAHWQAAGGCTSCALCRHGSWSWQVGDAALHPDPAWTGAMGNRETVLGHFGGLTAPFRVKPNATGQPPLGTKPGPLAFLRSHQRCDHTHCRAMRLPPRTLERRRGFALSALRAESASASR